MDGAEERIYRLKFYAEVVKIYDAVMREKVYNYVVTKGRNKNNGNAQKRSLSKAIKLDRLDEVALETM